MGHEQEVDRRTSLGPVPQARGGLWVSSERLAGLRQALGAYAAGFDPGLVTPFEASVVADEAAKIESIAAVVRGLAVSRGAAELQRSTR